MVKEINIELAKPLDSVEVCGGSEKQSSKKRAKNFDIDEMIALARKTALANRPNSTNDKSVEDNLLRGESSSSKFNMKKTDDNENDSEDDVLIGPPLPTDYLIDKSETSVIVPGKDKIKQLNEATKSEIFDNEDDDKESNEYKSEYHIPVSHEITLSHGIKPVSALALDPSGAQLLSGGYDYNVKFWNFAGMDSSLQSFRKLTPADGYPLHKLAYSSNGEHILAITGSSQVYVLNRDGTTSFETVRGYSYITDPANVNGHTTQVNDGCWNPRIKDEFVTCSNDTSARIWNVSQEGKKHTKIIKLKGRNGKRTIPTSIAYSHDGNLIAITTQDGALQLWDTRRLFVHPSIQQRDAHAVGTGASRIAWSYDGNAIATRGLDDTVKLWDSRKLKSPVAVRENLPNLFQVTDVIFSPNDAMILTCTSMDRPLTKGASPVPGQVLFMDRHTSDLDVLVTLGADDLAESETSSSKMNVSSKTSALSIIRLLWHPKINQMVIGTSDGRIKMLYDAEKSIRGAKLCATRPKKVQNMEVITSRKIYAPYALKSFRENPAKSIRIRELISRRDPVKSRRPDLPISGPGQGGRISEKGATLAQYVIQQVAIRKDPWDKDPRGAILRHAEAAEKNPLYVEKAYAKTQPKRIFQNLTESGELPETGTARDKASSSLEDDRDTEPLWKKQRLQIDTAAKLSRRDVLDDSK